MREENIKEGLMNDLFRVTTLMEELWEYHPKNPNGIDVEKSFDTYQRIKDKIEKHLSEL